NLPLVEQTVRKGRLDKVVWSEPVFKSIEYARKYHFFHWELEFPDAFSDERRGFDVVIMNPPWKTLELDDDDFFSQYYPRLRGIARKQEMQQIGAKLWKEKTI